MLFLIQNFFYSLTNPILRLLILDFIDFLPGRGFDRESKDSKRIIKLIEKELKMTWQKRKRTTNRQTTIQKTTKTIRTQQHGLIEERGMISGIPKEQADPN